MPDRPQNLRWADTVADELVGRIEKTRDQQRLGAKPRRKYEYSLQEAGKLHRNEGRERLERFERALRVLYDNGVRLGDQQRELVNEVTTALLPKFFGDDLVANLIYLRKKFGLTDISDTKSMIFPRRSGKTEGCAIIIAALAVSQPRGNCIMYNLTATQAKEFLQSVYKHLKTFNETTCEFNWTMLRQDARQLFELQTAFGISAIKSYASALKGDAKIGL